MVRSKVLYCRCPCRPQRAVHFTRASYSSRARRCAIWRARPSTYRSVFCGSLYAPPAWQYTYMQRTEGGKGGDRGRLPRARERKREREREEEEERRGGVNIFDNHVSWQIFGASSETKAVRKLYACVHACACVVACTMMRSLAVPCVTNITTAHALARAGTC